MSTNIHIPERESETTPVWHGRDLRQPTTMLGCWAVLLTTVFTIMLIVNAERLGTTGWQHGFIPFHGTIMLLCGLAGGLFWEVSPLSAIRNAPS